MRPNATSTSQQRPPRADSPRSSVEPARARKRHPLLETFPLAVMALAIVLMAFAFAMAAFGDASDLELRPSASAHSGEQLSRPL